MSDRTCPACLMDLTGAHLRRKFCSEACRRWVANGHEDLRRPASHCLACQRAMPPGKLASATYCTRQCKLAASHKRRLADGRERKRNHARYPGEREKRIAYATDYFRKNPHVAQATKRNRRSAASKGRVRPEDWKALCRRFGHRCAYCGEKLPLTMDHVVPLVRGGSNFIGNILPACRSCNCRKQGRFIMEWRMGKSRRTAKESRALAAGV